MSIKDRIRNWLFGKYLVQIQEYLKGKKTLIGAISLLLWVCIYAVPAFTPQYSFLTVAATQIRDALNSSGIVLDNSLFNTGVGFTVIGLLGKIMDLFKKEKDNG